jgi:hypothetical protein
MSVHAGMLAELAGSGESRGNYEQTLSGAIGQLLDRRRERELQDIKASGLDDETLRRLHEPLRQADPRRHPKII